MVSAQVRAVIGHSLIVHETMLNELGYRQHWSIMSQKSLYRVDGKTHLLYNLPLPSSRFTPVLNYTFGYTVTKNENTVVCPKLVRPEIKNAISLS